MNQDFVGLTVNTVAALRICAEYAGLLTRRICHSLLVTRNRGRRLSNESAWGRVDEMLLVVPAATATNLWNNDALPVEQLPAKIASPFGDW